jgi:hypothetical protein
MTSNVDLHVSLQCWPAPAGLSTAGSGVIDPECGLVAAIPGGFYHPIVENEKD